VFVRGEAGEMLAVALVTGCGRRLLAGPLAVRPGTHAVAAGLALCTSMARLDRNLLVDGITFPASVKHILMYRSVGMHMGTPVLFMEHHLRGPAAGLDVPAHAQVVRFSARSQAEQTDLVAQMRMLTNVVERGYDLEAEVRRVDALSLGDTLMLVQASRLVGFAMCHVGPRSEAFRPDGLMIRAAYLYPGIRDAPQLFAQLLDAAGSLARERGATTLEAGVDLRRRAALEQLQRIGFTPHSVWTHVWSGPLERRPVTPDQFMLEELR
jgi:hypothetical protein